MDMRSVLGHIVLCLAAASTFGGGAVAGDVPQPRPGSAKGQMLLQVKADAEVADDTYNWVLLARQTMPFVFERDQWSLNPGDPSDPNYAYFDSLESCRSKGEDGKFTFKLSWPDKQDQIWRQSSNPVDGRASGGVSGYEAMQVPYTENRWGGLEKSGHRALLDGSLRRNWWWYAVGSTYKYRGGIPGPNGAIVNKVELFVDCATTPPLPTTTTTTPYPANWVLMLRQTLPYLYQKEQWSKDASNPESDNYAILDRLESCRGDDGKFAFKLSWPGTELYDQVWKQTSNPVAGNASGGVVGYEPLHVSYTGDNWGGLEKNGEAALLDGVMNKSVWSYNYAVGSFRSDRRRRRGRVDPTTFPGPEIGVQRAELYADCESPPPPATIPGNWVLMLRQTMPYMFRQGQWSKNEHDPTNANYAILDQLESCRAADGKFSMRLSWPHSEYMDQVWRQSSNPVTRGTGGVEGYEEVIVPYGCCDWGGLEYNGDYTLLDGTVNSTRWDFFVGSWRTHSDQIPGPGGRIEKVELYADCAGPPQPPPPTTTTTTPPVAEGQFKCLPMFRCH